LMRTRMHDPPPSVVSVKVFHENTDCRLHIERGASEVRLYGLRSKIAEAQAYLEELGSECDEEVIPLEPGAKELPASLLQWIGSQYGVTVAQEDDTIVVLGLHVAVASAAEELLAYVCGQKDMTGPEFVEDSMSQISTVSTLPPLPPHEAVSPMKSALLHMQQQPQLPPQEASQHNRHQLWTQRQGGPARFQPSGSNQQPRESVAEPDEGCDQQGLQEQHDQAKEHWEEWRQQRHVYHDTQIPLQQQHSSPHHFQNESDPNKQQMQMQGAWMPQQPIMFVPCFPQNGMMAGGGGIMQAMSVPFCPQSGSACESCGQSFPVFMVQCGGQQYGQTAFGG